MLSHSDLSTELLISQLLEEDLRHIEYGKHAEQLQLDEFFTDLSALELNPQSLVDEEAAIYLLVQAVRLSADAACAETLQHSVDVSNVANQQLAQKLAAAEKKYALDAEFAKRLQAVDDDGELDTDDPKMQDAESFLGREVVESLMANDLNEKGKGKRTALAEGITDWGQNCAPKEPAVEDLKPHHNPICGICLEPFRPTYSPLAASKSANSSSQLTFGLHLPCPNQHTYCMPCLARYIKVKLEPEEDDIYNTSAVVFPILCPECPKSSWEQGIQDDIAGRLLDEKDMVLWHHRKLLDSIPRIFCPNPRCSAIVQAHEEEDEPQAICPACQSNICFSCRTIWHAGMDCEEYQSVPLDERSPEDQLTLQLAKAKNWRRCPSCAIIVELMHGCNHITCRCTKEFCFKCGSAWDPRRSKCSSNPSCELWDEDMLLGQRERDREAVVEARERRARPAHVQAPPPPYAPPIVHRDEFAWLGDEDIVCQRHGFTSMMVETLTCGYCNNRLNSLADLQYHLSHVRYHPVLACCGKLFKKEEDFERHALSIPRRFGGHIHEIHR